MSISAGKVALLDRDGTIIVDKVYLANPEDIEFAAGAIEGLRLLRDHSFRLVMITNQSGIARGYFDVATLHTIHDRLTDLLAAEGLALDGIYYCPHGPGDACSCRKPAPGMIERARADLGFAPADAVVIGDSSADMGAAAAAGVAGIRISADGSVADASTDFLSAARRAVRLFETSQQG